MNKEEEQDYINNICECIILNGVRFLVSNKIKKDMIHISETNVNRLEIFIKCCEIIKSFYQKYIHDSLYYPNFSDIYLDGNIIYIKVEEVTIDNYELFGPKLLSYYVFGNVIEDNYVNVIIFNCLDKIKKYPLNVKILCNSMSDMIKILKII